MALAGDHDGVAGLCTGHCQSDGLGAVEFDGDPGPPLLGDLGHPLQHRVRDEDGVLGARVVVGDDEFVGQARGGLAHEGAFGPVTVAPTSQDHVYTSLGGGPQRGQDRFDGPGFV